MTRAKLVDVLADDPMILVIPDIDFVRYWASVSHNMSWEPLVSLTIVSNEHWVLVLEPPFLGPVVMVFLLSGLFLRHT